MRSKVYFSRTITGEKAAALFALLERPLPGNVAVKVHSGEAGNQNFLRPAFWKPIIDRVGGTVVECNTAYEGSRNTTAAHWQTMADHGWNAFPVDIMDEEGPDLALSIPNGHRIQTDYVGRHLERYDSLLVLSHFKGHPMGGYGGALKQLSIGVASAYGKAYIHGAGDLDSGSRFLPGSHGRRRCRRGGALRRESRLYQRHGQHVRGLRLLRRGGGSLHGRHRRAGLHRSRGHRPGLFGSGLRRQG